MIRLLTICLFLFPLLLKIEDVKAEDLNVDVLALFKDAAMFDISGKQVLLKSGQQSKEGVKLISADSREATIEFNGKILVLNLSEKINGSFSSPETISTSILINPRGQYRTSGSINGRSTTFLVDTGANIMALNAGTARSLGIDLSKSRSAQVETASGMVSSKLVTLEKVSVGGISVRNVKAVVIDGAYPADILLGMSFLRNVDMSESAGIMQLTGKF